MRAVIQRVRHAQVEVDSTIVGKIDKGLLVLLGVAQEDCERDVQFLAEKCSHLRIFADEEGKMNRSLLDVGGQMLVVSQFTLYGDCRKGRRPSFIEAAPPEIAKELYELFCQKVSEFGIAVERGQFQADMLVTLANDGPVTLLLESRSPEREDK